MIETVTIRLKWPDAELRNAVHGKGNKFVIRKIIAASVEYAQWTAKGFVTEGMPWPHSVLSLHFRLPANRNYDTLNLTQSCKPYVDGIVNAGVIVDDNWKVMGIGTLTCEHAKDDPGVDLTIERIAE